ncbi:unnamed protein product [Amoebophrya sp. A25]|nr:unnamed protein product [Amoebophrya sp. A25]|eukprot:GSA25T00001067001.1
MDLLEMQEAMDRLEREQEQLCPRESFHCLLSPAFLRFYDKYRKAAREQDVDAQTSADENELPEETFDMSTFLAELDRQQASANFQRYSDVGGPLVSLRSGMAPDYLQLENFRLFPPLLRPDLVLTALADSITTGSSKDGGDTKSRAAGGHTSEGASDEENDEDIRTASERLRNFVSGTSGTNGGGPASAAMRGACAFDTNAVIERQQARQREIQQKLAKAKRRIAELKERNPDTCLICCETAHDVTFLPCGHQVACAQCANHNLMHRCPLCRQPIERKQRARRASS